VTDRFGEAKSTVFADQPLGSDDMSWHALHNLLLPSTSWLCCWWCWLPSRWWGVIYGSGG